MLLRDRSDELAEAGIRPFGLSRDSLWSHRAWAETLGVEVPLLTDWEGDVVRAFGADRDVSGMSGVPRRSAFLIEDGETIVAAWMLDSELPTSTRSSRPREPCPSGQATDGSDLTANPVLADLPGHPAEQSVERAFHSGSVPVLEGAETRAN